MPGLRYIWGKKIAVMLGEISPMKAEVEIKKKTHSEQAEFQEIEAYEKQKMESYRRHHKCYRYSDVEFLYNDIRQRWVDAGYTWRATEFQKTWQWYEETYKLQDGIKERDRREERANRKADNEAPPVEFPSYQEAPKAKEPKRDDWGMKIAAEEYDNEHKTTGTFAWEMEDGYTTGDGKRPKGYNDNETPNNAKEVSMNSIFRGQSFERKVEEDILTEEERGMILANIKPKLFLEKARKIKPEWLTGDPYPEISERLGRGYSERLIAEYCGIFAKCSKYRNF